MPDHVPGDPELYFAEDGTPRSARFGDIYYSPEDGLAESRAVFLQGCHLPDEWQGRDTFTVLELGFGTGLNICALMQLWAEQGCPGRLHVFTVEAFVITREQAQKALANWPELADFAGELLRQWPRARRGFHHMDFPQWKVSVTVALMEVEAALDAWEGPADAVFLDGFSPALNPDMWSPDTLARVGQLCRPGARLATFTVAGFVRRGLQDGGFRVEKRPGFGRKRERLEAVWGSVWGDKGSVSDGTRRIAIVGAGIAGAAVAWQARSLGLEAVLFDPAPGSGASGNAAALVTPRLDAGDNAISILFADAFAYATALYRRLCPEAIVSEGVVQRAGNDRDRVRFDKIAGQAGFAAGEISTDATGLTLHNALAVTPERVLAALIGDTPVVRDRAGLDLDGYDAVVLACGDGIFDLGDIAGRLNLRPVRGQIELAEVKTTLDQPTAWGGYAIPMGDRLLFGATHDRDDRGCDVRDESRAANLTSLTGAFPELADADVSESRASIRVTTRDYLPVIGEIAPGVYILSGLGARGFCLAPLLAKAVLADITGVAGPLPAPVKKILQVCRLITP